MSTKLMHSGTVLHCRIEVRIICEVSTLLLVKVHSFLAIHVGTKKL